MPTTLSIPYLGESLALLTAIVWALAVVLFKKSGETVHPVGLNLFKNMLATALFLPTIWLWGGVLLLDAPTDDYLLLLLSGAVGIGIADTLFFQCLNRLGAGLTAIVDCLYSPFIIGLSMLWLGDVLTLWQVVGVVLIISAVLTAARPQSDNSADRRNLFVGITYGVLAMALMAIGVVIAKPILDRAPLLWVTEVRLIGGVIILWGHLLFHPGRRRIVRSVLESTGRVYTVSGSIIGGYLAMIIWLAGMKFTQVSTAAALNQTNNIFIFIFAALILKEKIDLLRTIGITLAVGGAFLVTFG